MTEQLTDEQLINCVRRPDVEGREAFAELYRRYAPRLLAYLAARCPAGVESSDLSQDVWIKAYRRWETFDGRHLMAWLITIARNALLDLLRRKAPYQQSVDTFDVCAPPTQVGEDPRLLALRDCVASLDTQFVRAFVKVKVDGEPIATIAASEGVSPNTIYTRIHRGGQQLAECIESRLA
jgi:RNA polymerase sigma-70 factor, ECF subfamily